MFGWYFAALRWLNSLFKLVDATSDYLLDSIGLRGDVCLTLVHANGPDKGKVAKRVYGRNVVTSWLSSGGVAPTSGRDLLRRCIVPASFSGSLAADADATIQEIELGSGVTAETPGDTSLETAISGTAKAITDVTFDAVNSYVTFSVVYDETEANVTLSEAALLSGRGDFVARKTFGAFTKTSDYTLEIRWTLRF